MLMLSPLLAEWPVGVLSLQMNEQEAVGQDSQSSMGLGNCIPRSVEEQPEK